MRKLSPLILLFTATLFTGFLFAQERPTKSDVEKAIQGVESLASGLTDSLDSYNKHLKKAMQSYGGSFYHPAYKQKLAGFSGDVQTGDVEQTEAMKLSLFATLLRTAGIRLDPDPLRDWERVEALLDRCEGMMQAARGMMEQTNVVSANGQDEIPAKALIDFRRRWRTAQQDTEKACRRADSSRPKLLQSGETFEVRAIEGRNIHVNLFGLQFGNDFGNVIQLVRLSYSGKIEPGHLFLLTVLASRYQKTRVDTSVTPRAVLMYSDPHNTLLYGHAVTMHSYAGYSVAGARISSVAPHVRDWVWKAIPPSPYRSAPSLPDLEEAVAGVKAGCKAIDAAIHQFQRLASDAVRENDMMLKTTAKGAGRKARVPEQELAFLFPDIRARLYAARALMVSDSRFVSALEAVTGARQGTDGRIAEARELFSRLNIVPVYEAPEAPWKRIDELALDLMVAAEQGRRRPDSDASFISRTSSPPSVVVAQESRGNGQVEERILRDVHWAIKGVDRREYTYELIRAAPLTGIHQVQRFVGPAYVQGPGGMGQTFQRMLEHGEP